MTEQIHTPTPTPVANALSKKAMIARLSTGGWSGRMTDQAATKELTELKRAKEGATSVTKSLIDKKHFKQIREAVSSMKKYHKEQTMPWDNNGGRLLPSTQLAAYNIQLRECKRLLNTATTQFIAEYETFINEAEESLGDLFKRTDYPTVQEIEGKFLLHTTFEKVPEAEDFRVEIADSEKAEIRSQIETKVNVQHASSMKRVWLRIFKAVEHMHTKLSESNGIFRNTLIENIEQLVSILPDLNILNDAALADMTLELENKLCGYTPEDLRRNQVLRAEVVENSREVLDKIKSMDGLFGINPDQIIVDDHTA